eukprot:CAMPEP_0175129602 /NCGR_PEP_ID=MMETSP0087-20121206/5560_1 /TAXON_ID=136419 /ORGANISM="Unknown Unknown, Strain D1" /LENGTH=394 /DNA_ID=CAMNT_0016411763 /DNA_START=46 /DNA_END=1227 /DNA_ORIENTATION=+
MASFEIKSMETHSYYAGNIQDVDSKKKQILVSYENNWKPMEWVDPGRVRASPLSTDRLHFHPQVGDIVETMARSSDEEPKSWWEAEVRNIRGDFFVISYTSWDDSYNEIVEFENLRPRNTALPVDMNVLRRVALQIPAPLLPKVNDSMFKSVRAGSGVLLASVSSSNSLILLGTDSAVSTATALAKMVFKREGALAQLQAKATQHTQKIQELEQKLQQGHVEEFRFDPAHAGIVIGKKGKHVKEAKNIPGVLKVSVVGEQGLVSIRGDSAEVCLQARALLETSQEHFYVERKDIGRVVGPKWTHIREIIESSGASSITLQEDPHSTSLVIVGRLRSVQTAKLLLQQHMDYLQEFKVMRDSEQQLADRVHRLRFETGVRQNDSGGGQGIYRDDTE